MAQSIATRAALLTRLNARTEVFIAKLEDETRDSVTNPTREPDADLLTPVIPGLYLFDVMFVIRSPVSTGGLNGLNFNFSGPLGITDGGYGAFAQFGTLQRNAPDTGLAQPNAFGVGAALVNINIYLNQSGWFAVREPGDLQLLWTGRNAETVTLLRGSSLHLVRAINDGDAT